MLPNTMNLLADGVSIGAYVVDIIVLIGIVLITLLCAKKGFINCIFGFVSSILAVILAISLAGLFVNITGGLFGLESVFSASFAESFSQLDGFDVVIQENMTEMEMLELLEAQNMSAIFAQLIGNNLEGAVGRTLGDIAGETLGNYATLLVSGVILFIGLRILFAVLKKFFNFVAKDGLLGGLNKLLGALIGLLEALLIASFIVTILELFPGSMEFLNSSIILTWLHHNNLLLWFLSLFIFL